MAKNYYVTLGVSRSATMDEIRAAFRRRSKELHPDASGLSAGPFLDLQEAYAVLSDPDRRRHYDQTHPSRAGAAPISPRPSPAPFRGSDVDVHLRPEQHRDSPGTVSLARSFERYLPSFDELFDRLWRNFSPADRLKGERAESLTIELVATPDEALRGGAVRVTIPGRSTCPTCRGYGTTADLTCWQCGGSGAVIAEHSVEITYPAGMRDGHLVRVPLANLGIDNLFLTVAFRVSDAA